jgi:SAM-dependent methyltransferase
MAGPLARPPTDRLYRAAICATGQHGRCRLFHLTTGIASLSETRYNACVAFGTRDQAIRTAEKLWMGYGPTIENFLSSGKVDVEKMKKILGSVGFRIQDGNRVLDLGCASGRMIRWLNGFAEQCEIWGVDISAEHIIWCQQHLSPPFNFAAVTTSPHLPFEDGYFDLIYCGSVFTHIADLADAWLLELKRIARPGGKLYVTVHDRQCSRLDRRDRRESSYKSGRDMILTAFSLRQIQSLECALAQFAL